jgi:predicted Co/Zn/Cd cation transporter (cation efflux family)
MFPKLSDYSKWFRLLSHCLSFFTVMAIISYILDKNSIFAMLNEFIDAVITVLITVTFIVETTKYVKRNGKNRQNR